MAPREATVRLRFQPRKTPGKSALGCCAAPAPSLVPALLALVAITAAAACRREETTKLLSERQQFAGKVAFRCRQGGVERALEGELAFSRQNGHLQFVRRGVDGGRTVTLSRLGEGELKVFVDGEPRPPSEQEVIDFSLVWRVVNSAPASGAEVVRGASSYEIDQDDLWFRVEFEERQTFH